MWLLMLLSGGWKAAATYLQKQSLQQNLIVVSLFKHVGDQYNIKD